MRVPAGELTNYYQSEQMLTPEVLQPTVPEFCSVDFHLASSASMSALAKLIAPWWVPIIFLWLPSM